VIICEIFVHLVVIVQNKSVAVDMQIPFLFNKGINKINLDPVFRRQ